MAKYEAAEKPQSPPKIRMKLTTGPLTSAVPLGGSARSQTPAESRAAGNALQEAVSSSNTSPSPAISPQQKHKGTPGKGATDAASQDVKSPPSSEKTKGNADEGRVAISKENIATAVPKASASGGAGEAVKPAPTQHAHTNGMVREQNEVPASPAPRSSVQQAKGSELRGGFLGSALAGKTGKQAAGGESQPPQTLAGQQEGLAALTQTQNGPATDEKKSPELQGCFLGSALAGKAGKQAAGTISQPITQTQAGQQESTTASSQAQNGLAAVEMTSELQGGFLGKALAGKSRPKAAAATSETDKNAAETQASEPMSKSPDATASQGTSSHATSNCAAVAANVQLGESGVGTVSRAAAGEPKAPSSAQSSTAKGAEDAPAEKSTAAALEVAQRALAAKQLPLRTPTSGTPLAANSCSCHCQLKTACLPCFCVIQFLWI